MKPFNKLLHKSVLVVIGNSSRSLFTEHFKVQDGGILGKELFCLCSAMACVYVTET
jgi:hypothetical protein